MYLLDFVVVLLLHGFFFFAPCLLTLVLPLLFALKLLLKLANLILELRLVGLVRHVVDPHGFTRLNDVLLKLDTVALRVLEIGTRIFRI